METVAVVQRSVDLPTGWDDVCRRWGDRLGVILDIETPRDLEGVVAAVMDAVDRADAILLGSADASTSERLAAAIRDVAARTPVVHVDVRGDAAADPVPAACSRAIRGRGRQTWGWGLAHAVARVRRPAMTLPYGPSAAQVGDLRIPEVDGPHPVVVLLHGGFWLDPWERDLMDGLAVDLTERGWATWNVEYRRLGPTGGGVPQTFDDVVAATAHLGRIASRNRLDLARVWLLGHSAGATLAAWVAANRPDAVRLEKVVLLAGVLDLDAAAREDLGLGSVRTLLGDPGDHPASYQRVSPVALAPLPAPTLLVHGTGDVHVPIAQSRQFLDVSRAGGGEADLVEVSGADHFALIDPASEAWARATRHLGSS